MNTQAAIIAQADIEALLKGLGLAPTLLDDRDNRFNFAVTVPPVTGEPMHVVGPGTDQSVIAVVAGVRFSDQDWDRVLRLNGDDQKRLMAKLKQALLLAGFEYTFSQEAAADRLPRRVQIARILDAEALDRSALRDALYSCHRAVVLIAVIIEESLVGAA